MKIKPGDLRALAPFAVLFTAFLWPLIILQKSFLLGDYAVQHAPWAAYLAESLKEGVLPLWTRSMTCGFPLAAEGQIGAFYPLHWLLYRALPFEAAYAWNPVFHFLLAGVGFYAYTRKLGLSRPAAGLAVLPFVFGSGYAGCFYNTGSLRVLSWLPWALYLLQLERQTPGGRFWSFRLLLVSMVFSLQWTAGFSQLAVYSFAYCILHEAAAVDWKGSGSRAVRLRPVWFAAAAMIVGTLFSLPQVLSSMELLGESIRSGESVSFALWGSVPPPALAALVFPEWGSVLRVSFYIGVIPFYLAVCYLFFPKEKMGRAHLFLAVIFFLLALGKHNPVYRFLVEQFSMTQMRNPSKFLFFTVTSLSVLAGMGLDSLVAHGSEKKLIRRWTRLSAVFLGVVCFLPLAAELVRSMAAPHWDRFAADYVGSLILEKGSAAKPEAHYLYLMSAFFEGLDRLFSYGNPFNLQAIALALAGVVIFGLYVVRKIHARFLAGLFLILVVLDLHAFGVTRGAGFLGNIASFAEWRPPPAVEKIKRLVKKTTSGFAELVQNPANEYLPPNTNMRHGLVHPGGYSPLLLKRYYELTYDLGMVDGSKGRAVPERAVWETERPVLDLIGAGTVHADQDLGLKGFKRIEHEKSFELYENQTVLPELVIYSGWKALPNKEARLAYLKSTAFDPETTVVLNEAPASLPSVTRRYRRVEIFSSKSDKITARARVEEPGIALARIASYPGWRVWVDGSEVPTFTANHAFLGFLLVEGTHDIKIAYRPTLLRFLTLLQAAGWAVLLLILSFFYLKGLTKASKSPPIRSTR